MAEREINEFEQIMEHIHNGNNFLLSGGAGSGKTFSLVQIIRQIIDEYPFAKIACMTYTNSAVKEIEERVNHKNLTVTTIHDFLWENIKNFQTELKLALIDLANNEEITNINIENVSFEMFADNGIQYKENVSLKKGFISHDELLIVAQYLFHKHKKLSDIIKDKFPFILIDEYQDTDEKVIQIFLEDLKKSKKKNIIGFFGDAMQSIYDNTIGNLDNYKGIDGDLVREVKKVQNRRNPEFVINLANQLRTDGIIQEPQLERTNPLPPNMNEDGTIKQGKILFLYSINYDLSLVKNYLGWDLTAKDTNNKSKCKELNLTHNLIAKQALFQSLMDIYNNDQIIEYKNLINKHLKEHPEIEISEDDTFEQVIAKSNINPKNGLMSNFINEKQELFTEAKSYLFSTFKNIYLNSDILTDDKKQDEKESNKKGSKRDDLLKHLFKIQDCIRLYNEKSYNEFLRKVDFKINSINDKQILKDRIEELTNFENLTIGQVIEKANEYELVLKDDKLNEFIQSKEYVFNRVCKVQYQEFFNVYNYLEGFTPFSTQHKTKGNEFENVLVILDNGKWAKYNFEYLFTNRTDKETVLNRTQKLFYVCCTRAKENLAVYYNSPSQQVLETARNWFNGNVKNLDE
jgi:DNA helicase-2/ATP-dependent DNA helicase PcrA